MTIGDKVVADSSEVGAFDGSGSLVGSGTVIHGIAAFAVWGIDPQSKTKKKDGCAVSESVTFRLWDGKREYPLDYVTQNGTPAKYGVDKVFLGVLSVPDGYLITKFDLTRAYPNPFRGSVKIAFDVPTIGGVSQHAIELAVYDLKGSLVKQLASGLYRAGHYSLAWNSWRGPRVCGGFERVYREDEGGQLRQEDQAGQNSIRRPDTSIGRRLSAKHTGRWALIRFDMPGRLTEPGMSEYTMVVLFPGISGGKAH